MTKFQVGLAVVAALGLAATGTQAAEGQYPIHERGERLNGPPLKPDQALAGRVDAGAASTAQARRELAYTLIAQSDASCENYLVGVSEQRNKVVGGLSIASLFFNALSVLSKPAQTKNALAQAAGLSTGASSELQNTIMNGNEYRLIYTAVKNGRQERRRQLYADIHEGKFDTWSSTSITSILTPYHHDCGINYALERLEAAARELGKTPADERPEPVPEAPAEAAAPRQDGNSGVAPPPTGPRAPRS
ncbi:MAG: hypothetical protein Q8S47_10320 [Phenylobacterium sp.]|nr:hypothetical protein [Phenylobacterium sp.]